MSTTFVRSDPSMLVTEVTDTELQYRADANITEDKLLQEKIRCTACNQLLKNVFTKFDVSIHPAFQVIICEDCAEFYETGEFSVDEDGSDKYCRWCGQGGSLFCCSRCSVAICEKCVKHNFAKSYRSEIEDDEWKCFVCDSKPIWPHRALAAAVRDYVDNHKPERKAKRRKSDDSDGGPHQSKRAKNDDLDREEKSDTDDDDEKSSHRRKKSKKSDDKEFGSSRSPRKSKVMISSSDEGDSDSTSKKVKDKSNKKVSDASARSRSNREKSDKDKLKKRGSIGSEPEDDSDEFDRKSRRSSRKSTKVDYKEKEEADLANSRSRSRKSEPIKKDSGSNRRSKKIPSENDDGESDRSVFREKNESRRSGKSNSSSGRRSTSDGRDSKDSDAIRLFQHLLKDTLKDFDKLMKIIDERKNSFREKYVDEKKHLRNLGDVADVKEKYIAFLGNLVTSTKRIESTFLSSVEPLVSSATSSKKTKQRCRSRSSSPKRKSADAASKLSNGILEKSDAEVMKVDLDGDVGGKKKGVDDAPAKTEVDEDEDEDDVDKVAAKGSDVSADSSVKVEHDDDDDDEQDEDTAAETSKPASDRRQSSASPKKDVIAATDTENDTTIPFEDEQPRLEKKKRSREASETNGVETSSKSEEEKDDDELTASESRAGESDSLFVNLGTEDESILSNRDDSTALSAKEKSAKADLLDTSDTETSSCGKEVVAADDGDADEHSNSKEERPKKNLLQKSGDDSSSENESGNRDGSSGAAKKRSLENDRGSPPASPSQEKRAKDVLLKESDVDEDDVAAGASEDSFKSKETQAKKDLLQSSDSSTSNHDFKSNSDSGMSGVDVLKKSSDDAKSRQKRRTKRLRNILEARQGKDSDDDEDKEINRLMNLKSLKRKKPRVIHLDSEEAEEEKEADSEKENQENMSMQKISAKKPTPKKSLNDYLSDGSDDHETDKDDDPFSQFNSFLDEKKSKLSTMTQNDLCKQQLLDSSDSENGNESDTEVELILPSKQDKLKKSSKNSKESKEEIKNQTSNSDSEDESEKNVPKKKKKRAEWRNDRLLRSKLSESDSTDEEEIISRIRKREVVDKKNKWESGDSTDSENLFRVKPLSTSKKKRKVLKSSSESSSSGSIEIIQKPEVKNRKKNKRTKKLWSDSDDSDLEAVDNSQNTEGSASKGRKNIRKVMKDEELTLETKMTAKQEELRKKRISERQALFNEVFQVLDVATETPSKLVLDFDPETKTELVAVHPELVKKLKPHQVQGIKFMWDSCFESLKQIENNRGGGCILAHCMGLGKTLQVIVLVHTILRYPATTMKKVLIICPVSTILNWVKEFKMWLEGLEGDSDIDVWYFNKLQKNAKERSYLLKRWSAEGGVMIMGYDKFRGLVNCKNLSSKWKDMIHETLLDPGPDLVICDEGHTLKNEKSAVSIATMKIRTRRRVVLTGTPLQNNLNEYHCMVQFVKPNLLGDKKEFLNRFANPITNGQFTNSTAHDVRLMKRRSHVLHKMLDGIIQRFDYNVLTPFLPPKHEFVISVALSDLQATLYEHYIKTYSRISGNGENRALFKDYQIMRLIWTHPFAMNKSFEKQMKLEAERERDEDDSMDDFIVSGSDDESSHNNSENSDASVISVHSGDSEKPRKSKYSTRGNKNVDPLADAEPELEIDPKAGAWWRPFITDEDIDNYKQGPKLILLFAILRECELISDKVLVFSQSIPSLDMIEHFLKKTNEMSRYASLLDAEKEADYIGTWKKNIDYFRLDGSTPSEVRTQYTNRFNQPSNSRARLFLISTKAGGLGINLTAANRVIIFDASWNPSHDVQSIFRVYRFGQKKPCYIYRFLSQGTMEEKIYERQVTKLSISCRVVDEQQIDRHFSRNEVEELYTFARKTPSEDEIPKLPSDRLMAEILKEYKNFIISYHEHDSLLENIVDEELTEEERKQAWEEYENDKKPKAPLYPQMRTDGLSVSDETIIRSIKQQNPNATPEMLEDMKNKVRLRIMQYYAEQQRMLHLTNNQSKQQNVQLANKKELDEQMEMRRRAFAYNMQMGKIGSAMSNGNSGMELIRWPEPVTPTKMASSPSKFGAYASPMKSAFPLRSPGRTPLKHVNNLSPLKGVGNGGSRSNSFGDGCFPADTSFLSEPLPTFKPLETPSTWSFKWTKPINDLGHLERILKANCRFLAQYDRVGENVLMHLPFCVRVDTLKQKLADHLRDISFSRVMVTDLDEQDVLDIIMKSL